MHEHNMRYLAAVVAASGKPKDPAKKLHDELSALINTIKGTPSGYGASQIESLRKLYEEVTGVKWGSKAMKSMASDAEMFIERTLREQKKT